MAFQVINGMHITYVHKQEVMEALCSLVVRNFGDKHKDVIAHLDRDIVDRTLLEFSMELMRLDLGDDKFLELLRSLRKVVSVAGMKSKSLPRSLKTLNWGRKKIEKDAWCC